MKINDEAFSSQILRKKIFRVPPTGVEPMTYHSCKAQFAVFTVPIIHLVYPPNFLHKHCFQFLLGFTMTFNRPKRICRNDFDIIIESCNWQDMCHTHKNLVYDLAHHESPIAQWLEHPTGILEGHGRDSHWGNSENLFSEYST